MYCQRRLILLYFFLCNGKSLYYYIVIIIVQGKLLLKKYISKVRRLWYLHARGYTCLHVLFSVPGTRRHLNVIGSTKCRSRGIWRSGRFEQIRIRIYVMIFQWFDKNKQNRHGLQVNDHLDRLILKL